MVEKTIPDVDDIYPLAAKISLLLTLLLFILAFVVFTEYIPVKYELKREIIVEAVEFDQIETAEIEPPKQVARPAVPVEAAEAEVDEDIEIMDTEFDFSAPPPPPPPPAPKQDDQPQEEEIFVAYDTPPQPIRLVKPEYPEIAKQAGIEGQVLLMVTIGSDGRVKEAKVIKSLQPGPGGLDEAAKDAAMKSVFSPAKQRDKPVAVKITLPFNFTLEN
jgi:protein TonB